ncbi:MAG: hypothetical protein ACT4UQ_06115 [Gammaproteobacteria bacterium]
MITIPRTPITAWLSAVILVASGTAGADGVFATELGPDAATVAADTKINMMNGDKDGLETGRGLVPHLKTLGKPPGRVALVSFYVWDCGNEKERSYRIYGGNYVYHVTSSRNRNVASGEVAVLANELHDAGIGALKESFAAVGMQLLTPEEFLDTPAKLEAYRAFKLELGGINTFLRGLQEKGAGGDWQWGAPDGYRVIELLTVGNVKSNQFQLGMQGVGVAKAAVSLGHDLAQALGVDAVVILDNVVQADKTTINMRGAGLYMFGPNPIAESGQSMYWSGHQYSGVYLRMKDIPFIKTDQKGNLVSADYAGYSIVAGALGTRMAQHI